MVHAAATEGFTAEEIDGYASRFLEKYGEDAVTEALDLSALFQELGDKRPIKFTRKSPRSSQKNYCRSKITGKITADDAFFVSLDLLG